MMPPSLPLLPPAHSIWYYSTRATALLLLLLLLLLLILPPVTLTQCNATQREGRSKVVAD